MPSFNDVLKEIKSPIDAIRHKYLKRLHNKTKRNIICYYSGWLQNPNVRGIEISDVDKNGFMNAIHGLNRSKGLDIILHTPGGEVAATESIVDYIRQMFGTDVRAIVPQLSMSAGTMIACSCKSIVLGTHSNLGPVDPQFGGIPAQGVVEEFRRAIEEIKKTLAAFLSGKQL
ncbi:MAG: periplasmic serine protease (ClpP class) [Candidatus Magnetoglobus multicellularis str. Araruama]|uniref:Periplasmic serine protease (ClpP class) n=1 Tax=Candidatus Magnetoglobus multicellularis str. Araruama TaxID=890399 RepID=A0A1V1NW43_9BACT|nr:MAG: periplasmic serine protease (ClpP class) [Candidatus Magnetoglobus multicellularis str. Araruama]